MNECWIFVKCFLYAKNIIQWLKLFDYIKLVDDFPLDPHFFIIKYNFNGLLDLFSECLFIFWIYIHELLACCLVFSLFGYVVYGLGLGWVESTCIFWKELCRLYVISFSNVYQVLPVNQPEPWDFFVKLFLITN